MKQQIDKNESWQKDMLFKRSVDKYTKWHVDEMAS